MSANKPSQSMTTSEKIKDFTRLWTKAQPTVSAFISSFVRDTNEAEDVLQEVSITLLDHFDQYDPERPFVPWAIGMAKYEVLTHRRKSAIDRHVFDSESMSLVADAFSEIESELSGVNEALSKCLKSIKGKARKAFDLRYGQELKPAEIAENMNMNVNAVSVLLHRARNFLRRCIKQRIMVAGVE